MFQQLLTKSGKKQRLVSAAPRPASVRSSQAKLPSPILQLQRTLGNRRLAQLIRAKRVTPQGKIIGLQRKLTVGAADDQYEQEADHMARQVMSMPDTKSNAMQPGMSQEEEKEKTLQTKALGASITPFAQRETGSPEEVEDKDKEKKGALQAKRAEEGIGLQRQPEMEEEEKKPIQARAAGSQAHSFEAGDDVESRLTQSKGGGSLLPDSVRAYIEPRFGTDFSHVRVHTGNEAMQMNRDVGAQAFTHGSDIYYGANHHPGNLELTAHELTHVVQQTGAKPLQSNKPDGKASINTSTSMQRACPACDAGNKKEASPGPFSFVRRPEPFPDFVVNRQPTDKVQKQLIPSELRGSANVRGMTREALQGRYDLIVQTLKQLSATDADRWWLQAELDNIAHELARREALKAGRTFGETEITKMKEYFVDNATSATPKSCIACMNEALRLLLNDPHQKVGSEVEKTMAKLQTSGHAGAARFIEFEDKKGRITKGTLYPNNLHESIWDAVTQMVGGDVGWSVFGMSVMDGNHSVTLTLDNNDPAAPHLYWSDQWSTKGGWKEYDHAGVDAEITRLIQGWWNKQPENRKFNTRITLWRLNQ
jgi:hypothetical protein